MSQRILRKKYIYRRSFRVKSLRLIFIAMAITTLYALITPAGDAAALEKADTIYGGEYHPITPPEWYGNVVMKKNIKEGDDVAPVVFEHWSHRKFYTCNVCHTELGFAWKAGGTNVTQADIEAGKKCGACHNGVDSFGTEKCLRCHSYGKKVPENSRIEFALQDFPPDVYGNKVNWVKALQEKKMKPVASLDGTGKLKSLDKDIVMASGKYAPGPPPVLFPHKSHTEVLDCKSCHPTRFKAKKGGNPEIDMMKIQNGQYCGACHGRVSFPLEDCFRCHSQEPNVPDWITGKDKKEEKVKEKKKEKKKEEKKKKKSIKKRKILF